MRSNNYVRKHTVMYIANSSGNMTAQNYMTVRNNASTLPKIESRKQSIYAWRNYDWRN